MRNKIGPESRVARGLFTGALGGFVSGITGVGGGALFVPLMTGVSRLPQHVAHGTSLAIVIFAAAAGAGTYIARGEVEWDLVAAIIGGAAVGAYFGATAMPYVSPQRLRLILGIILAVVGIRILAVS